MWVPLPPRPHARFWRFLRGTESVSTTTEGLTAKRCSGLRPSTPAPAEKMEWRETCLARKCEPAGRGSCAPGQTVHPSLRTGPAPGQNEGPRECRPHRGAYGQATFPAKRATTDVVTPRILIVFDHPVALVPTRWHHRGAHGKRGVGDAGGF